MLFMYRFQVDMSKINLKSFFSTHSSSYISILNKPFVFYLTHKFRRLQVLPLFSFITSHWSLNPIDFTMLILVSLNINPCLTTNDLSQIFISHLNHSMLHSCPSSVVAHARWSWAGHRLRLNFA